MKKIIRLTESDLARIVRRVISEQHSTLPDGVYYGDGSGNEYELFYDETCEKTTGYKVINAPRKIRGAVTASETNVFGGKDSSEFLDCSVTISNKITEIRICTIQNVTL